MKLKEFYEIVLNIDQHTCRSFFCKNGRGEFWSPTLSGTIDPPHHIKLKSQGGKNEVTNGITLCRLCHDYAHGKNNLEIDGFRVSGRQFMIMVLDALLDDPCYRWGLVHAELKRREG